MTTRFQVHHHDHGWWWRLVGGNNRPIAQSPDEHPDAGSARRDASSIASLAAGGRIQIVGDGRGWRWVLMDDGTIRAVSVGLFVRRSDCQRAISRFRSTAIRADIEEADSAVDVPGR